MADKADRARPGVPEDRAGPGTRLEVAGGVEVADGGDREDLVLVHGLGSASTYWDNLRPALGGEFQLWAPDLPGHGPGARRLSAAEAHPKALAASVVGQLRAQGILRPHLAGLSLGGWVVLEMAAMGYGASVTALSPAGLWAAGAWIPQELPQRIARRLLGPFAPALPLLARLPPVRMVGLGRNVAHPEKVSVGQFVAAARAVLQAEGYDACDRAAVSARFEGGGQITVPVTVAFGDRDQTMPVATSRDRSLLPPGARFETVGNCGHAMTWDQPEISLALIRSTVATARRGQSSQV